MDDVICGTLRDEAAFDHKHFLPGYAAIAPFVDPDARSLFVDGEVVMVLAARDLVEPAPAYRAEARLRADGIERSMRRSPSLSGESYPDQCWTFCNTTALAALIMHDRVSRADRSDLAPRTWVSYATQHLIERDTGLLVSSIRTATGRSTARKARHSE